jgi:hypothetical protein
VSTVSGIERSTHGSDGEVRDPIEAGVPLLSSNAAHELLATNG